MDKSKEFTNLEQHGGNAPPQYIAQPAPVGGYPNQGYPTQPYTGYQYPAGQVVVTTTAPHQPQPHTPIPCSYIVSLVFAIISCFLGCWVLSIPAIIFAAMALSTHHVDPRAARCHCFVGLGLWIASFVISAIIVVVIVVYVVQAVNNPDVYNNNNYWNDWSD